MFAPTKIWRKWHVKVNLNQKRFATVSAVAATALPSLVMARGHRIENVSEIPLVISSAVESITKTKAAVAALQGLHAHADVSKVIASKKIRAGKGKARGRKHRMRRGPLIVYNEDNGIVRAFRNVPGVETCNVRSLNLLQLAPGGHLGRFVIWTEGAFALLDEVFGTYEKGSTLKKDYKFVFFFLCFSLDTDSRFLSAFQSQRSPTQMSPESSTLMKFNPSFELLDLNSPSDHSRKRRTLSRTLPSSSLLTLTPRPLSEWRWSLRLDEPREKSNFQDTSNLLSRLERSSSPLFTLLVSISSLAREFVTDFYLFFRNNYYLVDSLSRIFAMHFG